MILSGMQKVCTENTIHVKYGPGKSLISTACKKECPFNKVVGGGVTVCSINHVRPSEWDIEDMVAILVEKFGSDAIDAAASAIKKFNVDNIAKAAKDAFKRTRK